MPRIPEHIVDRIFQETDLVALVKSYCGDLKKSGSTWVCKSPFTQEKTASFHVWPNTSTWKDFSSGKGGKAPNFLMEMERIDYREALLELARRAGIAYEDKPRTDAEREAEARRARQMALLETATDYFAEQLDQPIEGGTPRDYFAENRSIAAEQVADFRLGFATNRGGQYLHENLANSEEDIADLVALGLVRENERGKYDFFRDRAIFPICDWRGKVVAFTGRTMNGGPKYINSQESAVWVKSRHLYGLHLAYPDMRDGCPAILVEGNVDVVRMHQFGHTTAIAPCGTSLTAQQAKLLSRFTSEVVIAFDGDKAGKKATRRALKVLLEAGFSVTVASLPPGVDPDDMLGTDPDALAHLIENPSRWLDYVFGAHGDLENAESQLAALKDVRQLLEIIPDADARTLFRHEVEKRLGLKIKLDADEKSDVVASSNEATDQEKNDLPELPAASAGVRDGDLVQLIERDHDAYLRVCERLKFLPCEDFTPLKNGAVQVKYRDVKGRDYRITLPGGSKAGATRTLATAERVNAVFIPPQLRRPKEEWRPVNRTLIFAPSEMAAWLLAECGYIAVGLHRPDGFLPRRGHRALHKLASQVMREHAVERVAYLIPGRAFQLPKSDTPARENPYLERDTADNAMEMVGALTALAEVLRDVPGRSYHLPHDQGKHEVTQRYWFESRLLEILLRRVEEPEAAGRDLAALLNFEKPEVLSEFPVTGGTPYIYKRAFHLNDAANFFAFYGLDWLGRMFTWRGAIYEHNVRDGSVTQIEYANDAFSIFEDRGCYWCVSGDGQQQISDFRMTYHYEFKRSEGSSLLIEFTPPNGESQFAILTHREVLNADTFKNKIADISGIKANFWGAKTHIEQIHALERKNAREAKTFENHLGFDEKGGFYVFGNGLITPEGKFLPTDDNGVVEYQDKFFAIPAAASFNEERAEFYSNERRFQYEEAEVSFGEFAEKFIAAMGNQGLIALCFTLAALYQDTIFEKVRRFPHFSIQGLPSTGKSGLADMLARLFGDLVQTNLRTRVTMPSFERKTQLLRQALIMLNEFNLSNENVRRARLEEYLVGVYDRQGGEKTKNDKSYQAFPNSAIFMIGQEPFFHKDALAARCIIQVYEAKRAAELKTPARQKAWRELEDVVAHGISSFLAPFHAARPMIRAKFDEYYSVIRQGLSDLLPPMVSARMVENWAITITPMAMLMAEGVIEDFPVNQAEIVRYAVDQIETQHKRMNEDGVLALFFTFIMAEYGPRKKLSHQDVFLYEPKQGRKKKELRIRLAVCMHAFNEYLNRQSYGVENTTATDMQARFEASPAWLRVGKGLQVGYKTDETGRVKLDTGNNPIPATTGAKVICLDPDLIPEFSLDTVDWTEFAAPSDDDKEEAPY